MSFSQTLFALSSLLMVSGGQSAWANSCVIEEVEAKKNEVVRVKAAFPPVGVADGQFLQLTMTNLSSFPVEGAAEATDAMTGAVLVSTSGTLDPKKGTVLNTPTAGPVRQNVEVGIVIIGDPSGIVIIGDPSGINFCASLELVEDSTGRTVRTYEPTFETVLIDFTGAG